MKRVHRRNRHFFPVPASSWQSSGDPRIDAFSAFQVLFNTFLNRVCFHFSTDPPVWTLLFPLRETLQPYHFEQYFGHHQERENYLRDCLYRAVKERRPAATRFSIYQEVYAPLFAGGKCRGFLISGPVLDKYPTPTELRRLWKELSGGEGSDLNPDFLHYVRTVLNVPILDDAGLKGYNRLMGLLGTWFTKGRDEWVVGQVNRLKVDVFAPRFPHPFWVDWAVGLDKFFRKPEGRYQPPEWVREEVGISRMPIVAATLMPRPRTSGSGILESLCDAKRFQTECFLAARRLPETACKPLGDYGTIVLTSPRPGLSAHRSRLEAREKIQNFRRTLSRTLGMEVIAGIGSIAPEGDGLARSYQEAMASLHSAIQSRGAAVAMGNAPKNGESSSEGDLRGLTRALTESIDRSSPARLVLARERLIRWLTYAGGTFEAVKTQLAAVLHILLERFERKAFLDPSAARELGKDLARRLDSAMTLPSTLVSFREALDCILRYQDKPRAVSTVVKLRSVMEEIQRDPSRAWSLPSLCRQTGLSPPTFVKWFQKVGGTSFGVYLRNVRLLRAKELLAEESMGLERVAQECGYSSAGSFCQVFKRKYGISPRKFHPNKK